MGAVMAAGGTAGTTVSATLAACGLPGVPRIHVMAAGGIGGVHPGWTDRPDISPDLAELSRAEVCVVCAGAKSVLDIDATVEVLETLGVVTLGYGTSRLPTFFSHDDPEAPAVRRVDTADEVAAVCRQHWDVLRRGSAVVVGQPVPDHAAIPSREIDERLQLAAARAEHDGVRGPELTPFLLAELARTTDGGTIEANLALLERNATLAAAIASELNPQPGPADTMADR
jgi:pseudouridine-5'-phosphate glycosidase